MKQKSTKRLLLLALMIGAMTLVTTAGTQQGNDGATVTIENLPEDAKVIAYKIHDLEPPFVFTGVGSEQLCLNGYELDPVIPMHDPASTSRRKVTAEQMNRARDEYAFNVKRNNILLTEGVENAQNYCLAAGADSVVFYKGEFRIYWGELSDPEVLLVSTGSGRGYSSVKKTSPPKTLYERHQDLIEEFVKKLNKGWVLVFGTGYKTYIYPSEGMEAFELNLDRLRSGESLSSEECRHGILRSKLFLDEPTYRR